MDNHTKKVHLFGRLTLLICMIGFVLVPIVLAAINGLSIDFKTVFAVSAPLFTMYLMTSIAECCALAPVIGPGALYVANITGNVSGMKVPAAINSLSQTGYDSGTEEGDVISLIAVCTSTFVATFIVILGMAFLAPIFQPIYDNPVVQPAFQNVVPALYGALVFPFVLKSPKDAVAPFLISFAIMLIGGRSFYSSNMAYFSAAVIIVSMIVTYFLHKDELKGTNKQAKL